MKSNIMKQFDLNGTVAVITGGGGALCGTMARGLAGLGVKVAILDLSLENAKTQEKAIVDEGERPGHGPATCSTKNSLSECTTISKTCGVFLISS